MLKIAFAIIVLNSTLTGVCQQKRPPVLKSGNSNKSEKAAGRNDSVRAVTIPITVRTRAGQVQENLGAADFTIREDGEDQRVLSVRAMDVATPISVAVLTQEDVVSSIGLNLESIRKFIRSLPANSRIFVGSIRSGTLEVRQKFTPNLERAAAAVRPPTGFSSSAPFNPYVEVIEALKRFQALPAGRRAILLISDGLDASRGLDSASPSQSIDLERAINEAQRASVAVYSFYAPTATTINGSSILVSYAQGSLQRLSDETGGRAFFQGTGVPVSFDPFLRELITSLSHQLAVTYLSTHPDKGFHRIKILSDRSGIEINHPAGYTR
jgi:VWFA-related protein